MNTTQQRPLPFPKPTESQIERCKRVLAGLPQGTVKPASELRFDYQSATKIARRFDGNYNGAKNA